MGWCFSKYDSTAEGSDDQGEFSGGNIHLITDNDVWEQKLAEAEKDNKIVIANFSATWCDPCRMIAPYYRELSEQHPSIMFLSIDVDELIEFSSQWDIKATPTFFFLRNGEQYDKLVGANRPELQNKIASAVDSEAPS
ncbi:Thioredoxin domain-containing protein [Heracleum sosnowskyi]|uniref:Thioredoxin domain-containing protein n=1 Tax=Heracleum sosnowskyi TaxID=360622 RepID=A0AAD8GP26_9APIA|nr:Thioredoxin domain-containing protein [Heracleum sosnowskyi]